jgi:hypothetical protein
MRMKIKEDTILLKITNPSEKEGYLTFNSSKEYNVHPGHFAVIEFNRHKYPTRFDLFLGKTVGFNDFLIVEMARKRPNGEILIETRGTKS